MTPPAWLAKLGFRTVVMIVAALLIVAFLIWGPQACNNYFSQKKQIRVEKGQGKAGMESGEMAVGKAGENADKSNAIDATVEEAKNDIRNAPDGNSNDAALRASCKLRSYYDSERCARLRAADTAKLESGVPPVDLPINETLPDGHDNAKPWQEGFVGQTGQLEKANDRTADTDYIYAECLRLHRERLEGVKPGVFGRLFSGIF